MLLAMFFVILALLAAFLAIQAARLKARQRQSFRIYAAAFGVVFGYLLAEFPVTAYYGLSWAGTSFYLFDESTKTVHFDPIRGYMLSKQASRWCHIVNGNVEFVAWLKGNSQGFPSRTDFVPARTDASTRRIAVFGDSFSSGDYLDTNWPDRTQALAEAGGEKLQLLNFSLYGAGLANWWSILTRLVAAQNYELDGIVFEDSLDLARGETRAQIKMMQGLPGGTAKTLASEKRGAQSAAGIPGHGLNVRLLETAARFEGANEEDIQEQATGHAQGIDRVLFTMAFGDVEHDFFEDVPGTARERCAKLRIGGDQAGGQAEIAQNCVGERRIFIRSASPIVRVQNGQAICIPTKHFSKCRREIGLAILAQPLNLVLIAVGAEAEQMGNAREEPTERIGKTKRQQRA